MAAMVVLFFVMRGINRYYARVTAEVEPDETPPTLPASVHAVVLVSRLHKPALRALAFPEYVTSRWWQQLLHNQSALRFKARLLFTPGVVVVNVPYHLGMASQGWLGGEQQRAAVDKLPIGASDGPGSAGR